jgi:hypothetical protein
VRRPGGSRQRPQELAGSSGVLLEARRRTREHAPPPQAAVGSVGWRPEDDLVLLFGRVAEAHPAAQRARAALAKRERRGIFELVEGVVACRPARPSGA